MTGQPQFLLLDEARRWLRQQADEGAKCPCCNQFTKVYRRKITSQTARAMVLMWREAGNDYVYMPTLLGRKQADETKARYWGLIEEAPEVRDDGSSRVGVWRLTPKGVAFVRGMTRVPKYARIYDGRCLGFDDTELVDIYDALGTRFNYSDLMAGQ